MLSKAHAVPDAAPEGKRGDHIDWRERAECAPYRWDPANDPFFPPSGLFGATPEARRLCAACPVRLDCLEHARRTETIYGTHGFRAGHTAEERRAMWRQDTIAAKEAAEKALDDAEVADPDEKAA